MKMLRFSLFICLYALLNACAHHAGLSDLGDDASREDRRLLVTFVDRSLDNKLPANVPDDFRIHHQYGNSGWSDRIAHQLADRYHILLVAQWPLTTLGVSCVVYEVPESLQLQQVMAQLQNDREVAQVQPMQSFRVLDHETESGSGHPFFHLEKQSAFFGLTPQTRQTPSHSYPPDTRQYRILIVRLISRLS